MERNKGNTMGDLEKMTAATASTKVIYYNHDNKQIYAAQTITSTLNNERNKREAPIFSVPSSQLPWGVLGLYNTLTHTIYISNGLSTTEAHYVQEHERAHSYGAADEEAADNYAISKTGCILRPFGHARSVWIQKSSLVKW